MKVRVFKGLNVWFLVRACASVEGFCSTGAVAEVT